MKVYIEEYVEEKPRKYMEVEDGKLFSDWFYDQEIRMCFYVLKEPDWLKLEENTTYEFEFVTLDDDDTYHYRLWKRLDSNTVIVAKYYYCKWYKPDEKYIVVPDEKKMTVEEYCEKYYLEVE